MKQKKKIKKFKLPPEAVNSLRHKGGPHSSKKGERGYNRKRDKKSHIQD